MYINKKETVTVDKVFNNTVVGSEQMDVDVQYRIENVVINATGVCYASLKKRIGDSEVFFDNRIIKLDITPDVLKAAYTAVLNTEGFSDAELKAE
ncbi:TPA: hypothetical protein ACNH3T_004758 [Serratia marcescens]|uniref:hypothetical protein n=1 Tax=Serratia nevei TaxID=2703794 RepID=UPI002AA0D004|nr:hypothetical protein [Serratia nevei]